MGSCYALAAKIFDSLEFAKVQLRYVDKFIPEAVGACVVLIRHTCYIADTPNFYPGTHIYSTASRNVPPSDYTLLRTAIWSVAVVDSSPELR